MKIIPTYNMILLPETVTFININDIPVYLRGDLNVGEDVLLTISKERIDDRVKNDSTYYPIGITGTIIPSDDEHGLLIKLKNRVRINYFDLIDNNLVNAEISVIKDIEDLDHSKEAKILADIKREIVKFTEKFNNEGVSVRVLLDGWSNIFQLIAGVSSLLPFTNERKYHLLEIDSLDERCKEVETMLYEFIGMSEVFTEAEIERQTDNRKTIRETALKEQIRYLQDKLDEMDPDGISDLKVLEDKINTSGMNDKALKEAKKVLNRMKSEGKNGHEYAMLYDYLDFLTTLSWKKEEYTDIDLDYAIKVLDEEHFGLKKVKTRIIEQIAVMNLKHESSGSILLFVGAPGTGKTSIGASIAKSMGREYVRVSLGGIRDEADIRGHRRTYIGALPGRIMDGIHKSGVSNPVMVLDEVDKLSSSFDGDPASALLEVLDPEQNNTFTDHYMNVPYDLSNVMFICTANTTETIPEPLLNRMEVIQFTGYTETDKYEIAKKHLIPKALISVGLKKKNLKISDKAIKRIITDYTMESGVRGLKREIDTLARMTAVSIVKDKISSVSITDKNLKDYLEDKPIRHGKVKPVNNYGIVTGLAWTPAGGDILSIETMFTKGSGKVNITGQLGDVMKESVMVAISIVKDLFKDKTSLFEENDLHIHFPAGATKKDGPSAGITIVSALSSLVTKKIVDSKFAMTGEVSLKGEVMPIGGLTEKLMAAGRSGVKTVFIPFDNIDDLEEVAEEVKSKLNIIPVKKITEVLKQINVI